MGKEIKFRPATFYLGIVDMLAKEVEGQKDANEEVEEPRQTEGGRQNEEQQREQMVHSLEDAGGQVQDPGTSSSTTESKSSSGSATPRASSLPSGHAPTTTGSSGSITPRPTSRVEMTKSEDETQAGRQEQEGKSRSSE